MIADKMKTPQTSMAVPTYRSPKVQRIKLSISSQHKDMALAIICCVGAIVAMAFAIKIILIVASIMPLLGICGAIMISIFAMYQWAGLNN